MAGRIDISGSTKQAASRQTTGSMTQNDKIKLGVAVAILFAGGVWIAYYMGAFDAVFAPKADPSIPIVDGKPLETKEEVEEFRAREREYKEANEKHKEEFGEPSGS